jgi:type III pantothenate kinase
VGLVESLVKRITEELGGKAVVVATGGLADLIARETGMVGAVDQHLTLEGLRLIYERN